MDSNNDTVIDIDIDMRNMCDNSGNIVDYLKFYDIIDLNYILNYQIDDGIENINIENITDVDIEDINNEIEKSKVDLNYYIDLEIIEKLKVKCVERIEKNKNLDPYEKSLEELINDYRPIHNIPSFNGILFDKNYIINYIKDYYKKNKKTPILNDKLTPFTKNDVRKVFGNWTTALIKANVPLNVNFSKFIRCTICNVKMIKRKIERKVCTNQKCRNKYFGKVIKL